MNQIFESIYQTNRWNNAESVSGTGSTLEQTRVIRQQLPGLIEKYQIKSLLDIPCGDFHWMRHVPLHLEYIGADIVREIILPLSAFQPHEFRVLDITSSRLPKVDLVLTRDCLVHLSNSDAAAAIENIRSSGSKYLLTTTFPGRTNRDIQTGDWRPIDLNAAPFCFPAPLAVINEGCTECGGEFGDKSLALYDARAMREKTTEPIAPAIKNQKMPRV